MIIRKSEGDQCGSPNLSNRSDRGATTQAVLMSVYRTLNLRGLDPTKTLVDALREYVSTGKLTEMPG